MVLAQECPLKGPLILKDTQDGFAGQTGKVWTVAPDCRFTVAHQVGPKVSEPFKQGHLTTEQQTHLKELLARAAAAEMPEQLGSGPQVNARRIILSYDGKVSTLTLPPGGGNLNSLHTAEGEPAGWLLELRDSFDRMTGD